jgi:catechol 2,3-dioxygenase-like lactoylglutathione lyase family enzyme
MGQQFFNSSPYFVVRDVLATARWYRDSLGFQFSTWGEPVDFAIAFRDGVEIMLRQAKGSFELRSNRAVDPIGLDVYVRVADVDALGKELEGRGVTLTTQPVTRFYKWRELEVTDPNGYLLCFAEDVA